MRPRLFVSAAAAFSAALASAADPLPLAAPPAATAPALPPIPSVGPSVGPPALPAAPTAPRFLPTAQPEEKGPKKLPVVPPPRTPGETPPPTADAPIPMTSEPLASVPMTDAPVMPRDRSLHDDHLGPWNAVWVRGGYNYLWIKDAPTAPPLLATGPGSGTNRILLGGTTTNYSGFSGASIDAGIWLNERHTFGLAVGGFMAEKRSTVSSIASDPLGSPGLVRPFFNAQIGGVDANDSFLISAPGRYAGALAVESGARIDGFEINGLVNVANTPSWTRTFVAGFRYFSLDEYTTIYQVTRGLNGNTIPFFGQQNPGVAGVAITDRVRTRNQFYGTQMGGDAEYRVGPMFLDFGLKAALGPVHQVTEVSGKTVVPNGAGGPGGILAVGAIPNGNIGRSTSNYFAVLADANALLGVQISSNMRLGFGYQFLYLNTVVRPASQISTTIDPRLVPTAASFGSRASSSTLLGGPGTPPLTLGDREDFFVHGLRFLFEVQY